MKTVLVTGFGPYAEETENPSGVIAARLNGRQADGLAVRGMVLPVGTDLVGPALAGIIGDLLPDVVIVTGVTPGRDAPAVERVAINVRDFPIPDIDGHQPIDEPVIAAGPDAYLSGLPVKAILSRWREEGLPGYVSNSAGTYVCNQTFYLARHLTRNSAAIAGLVHVPTASDLATTGPPPHPSLPLAVLERSIWLAAVVAATHTGADVQLGAGTTS